MNTKNIFENKNNDVFISTRYTLIIGWGLLLATLFPSIGIALLTLATVAYIYQVFYSQNNQPE